MCTYNYYINIEEPSFYTVSRWEIKQENTITGPPESLYSITRDNM